MNCAAFERWLDEGLPASEAPAARAHAESCAACAASLRAAEAIETQLAHASFVAPADLTARVMARVDAIEARRLAPRPVFGWGDAFPWWVRAASDPATAAATMLCAALFWKWDLVAAAGITAFTWLAQVAMQAPPVRPFTFGTGLGVQLALMMVVLPAVALLALAAYRLTERWIERAAGLRT